MAQITGQVSGLQVTPAAVEDDSDEIESPEEALARLIITRLRQNKPKAAVAAAVDLVNTIAEAHGLSAFAAL